MRWLLPGYATIKCGMKASCSSTEQRGVFAAMAIEAYCVKCKAKKEMKDPVESLTKNGKPTAVPRFAVSALRNNLALTDDEKDGFGRPFFAL